MKTNDLPNSVKYEIHFDYSPAQQRFHNLSNLAAAWNGSNDENISQPLPFTHLRPAPLPL